MVGKIKKKNWCIALNVIYTGSGSFYPDIGKYILPTFENTNNRVKNKLLS